MNYASAANEGDGIGRVAVENVKRKNRKKNIERSKIYLKKL